MARLTVPPRGRIIRQQSLWSRLSSYPFDLWLSVSEDIQLVEWDSFAVGIGLPGGIGATFLSWLFQLYLSGGRKSADDIFVDVDEYHGFGSGIFNATSSFLTYTTRLLSLALLVICLINAVYCYTSTKSYTLLSRASDNVPDTPSARRTQYEEGDEVWTLNTWDLPLFNIYFMSGFSPVHLFIIHYTSRSFAQLILLGLLSGYLYLITNKFLVLVKDKSIIHGEVLDEYNKKVVQPIIAVPRRDVCVGTDSDTVEVFTPTRNTKMTTHSVRPRELLTPITWGHSDALRTTTSPTPTRNTNTITTPRNASRPKPWDTDRNSSQSPLAPATGLSRGTTSERFQSPLATTSRGTASERFQSPLANRFMKGRPSFAPQ